MMGISQKLRMAAGKYLMRVHRHNIVVPDFLDCRETQEACIGNEDNVSHANILPTA